MKLKIIGLVIFCLLLAVYTDVYALNLDNLKASYLEGNYRSVISEGEKMLAGVSADSPQVDELYYLLGLSYLKEGNYLRASDIFEIILKELKNSSLKKDALLSLGDVYFLKADFERAEGVYKSIASDRSYYKLHPLAYYRLSQVAFKKGDTAAAAAYLDKLKKDYPLNTETRFSRDACILSELTYSVQVGSFSNEANAKNLTQQLLDKGYPAYTEEVSSALGEKSYRVRVGKFSVRREAVELDSKLSQEGYPTRICP